MAWALGMLKEETRENIDRWSKKEGRLSKEFKTEGRGSKGNKRRHR